MDLLALKSLSLMRINFSNATHEEIQEGISRLGKTISEKVGREVALEEKS